MSPEIIEVKYALDTFYFLISGVLVMWMAAGFAMLEAGLVRAKNTTEILTKNVALFAIACTMYLLMGYTIMYGGSEGGILPDAWFGNAIANATAEEVLASNGDTYYSGASDFFFQVVFVATAMSIVSGAVAERMKLWAFLAFAVVMTGFIYPMQGMWKWGGGFLDAAGFQDFAGSGVVHMCGAAAALAGVLLLGPRKGKYTADGRINAIPGANMPLAAIGMFILWMGWFGFNGGSELKVSDIGEANAVADVFVNTNAAACGGLIAALIVAHLVFGKADLTMAVNGALAGLVAITAEPLNWGGIGATVIGAVGGVIVVFAVITMDKMKIDDPVGAISVHGVVGIWGLLAVCLSGNEDATLIGQLTGIGVIFVWTFVTSLIVWAIIKATMGIRVGEQEEYEGVDMSECGIEAYPEFAGSGK
ncbi:ammonium transporter [Porticoccus litoralis]|jgi:Amt family ammonium transporter|uniref:Ammonium transporter n=1 Tax=Porticoccus litoralis TaxID=434086 RepID=A0AAW8B1U0_9GAMM|nr:ammonium transporter [Porticoccus litoralis]MDP1520323.1 ammonium transporter [Porticoccus litoralis]